MRIATCVLALCLATTALPSVGQAQGNGPPITEPPSRNRLIGYFLASFGGEYKLKGNGLSGGTNADPGLGLGFRYENLVSDAFSISPMLEWTAFDTRGPSDRSHLFDFDVFLKIRKEIEAGGVTIEVYGGLPIGFTVASPDGANDAYFGFNMGALAGAALFFKDKYGVFLESGWRMHAIWRDGSRGLLNQGVIHIGGVFAI